MFLISADEGLSLKSNNNATAEEETAVFKQDVAFHDETHLRPAAAAAASAKKEDEKNEEDVAMQWDLLPIKIRNRCRLLYSFVSKFVNGTTYEFMLAPNSNII